MTTVIAGAAAAGLLGGAAAWQAIDHHAAPRPKPVAFDGRLAGVPMQRARCHEWGAAPAAQKRAAVRALSATIGGASTGGGVGTTLPDARVAALFDRVCGTPNTDNFVLYLIYARAAAFSGSAGRV